jgi:hypothetical protein
MAKLRDTLDKLGKALGLQKPLLARAQRRYQAARKRAAVANEQKKAALEAADQLRKQGHHQKAQRKDQKAGRLRAVATKQHEKAVAWRGRVKELSRRVHGIEQDQKQIADELNKLRSEHGVTIKGNKAEGGTPEQRWRAVCLQAVKNCSGGQRRNFYDQGGSWDVQHEIKPGPAYSERSDCSQFVTGMAWSAGLPDPNGANFSGGFTGTLVQEHGGWHQTTESKMRERGWGYIVYGGGVGHHTECYVGGERTVGHGSPPVDFGTINLFGDGDYRCFVWTGK